MTIPKTGLYKTNKGSERFSPEEDKEIVRHWPDIPKLEGRDRYQIKCRARTMGLRLSPDMRKSLQKQWWANHQKKGEDFKMQNLLRKIDEMAQGKRHTDKPRPFAVRDGNHVSKLFTLEQDALIFNSWPEVPKIANRTKDQVVRRYRLLKTKVVK